MPSTELRQTVLNASRRVVIKLGTQLLAARDGRVDARYLSRIAKQLAALVDRGFEITLVSSGAIGAGCSGAAANGTSIPCHPRMPRLSTQSFRFFAAIAKLEAAGAQRRVLER